MTLTGLHIFPIKSCAGVSVTEGEVQDRGLKSDRRWMLVDESRMFISQRTRPLLSLVHVVPDDNGIRITAPGMPDVFAAVPTHSNGVRVDVWGDRVHALRAEGDASAWFSRFLGTPCTLVYMPDASKRRVDTRYAPHGEVVSFADGFPFLLLSEASLYDLNTRLPSPLPMNRFRPNLVVAGCVPYEEDSWKEIRIGEIRFRVAKPCARCVTTTVDQSTGQVTEEPLRTLATYRKRRGKVLFGQNLLQTGIGRIRCGDTVEVLAHAS